VLRDRLCLALALLSPALAPGQSPDPSAAADPAAEASLLPSAESIPPIDALVIVREFGNFRIRFYREDTPNHVAHFLTLAAAGFYDGMSFHRVIPRFLVQTGDPSRRDEDRSNDGTEGPSYSLPPEPNGRTHARGTVSMAWRGKEPGTAGTQWFVTLGDVPELDDQATVIGEVVGGMDTIDRIAQVTTFRDRSPRWRVVIEEIRLVESIAPEEDGKTPPPEGSGDPLSD
jgi:peptidyl-prolyl cis-trans isomerase B (cyclophilin B)